MKSVHVLKDDMLDEEKMWETDRYHLKIIPKGEFMSN